MDYQIKNHEWERIVCILSAIQGIKTKNELKLRRFIEAIWFIVRTGCQWRLLSLTLWCLRSIHIHQRFMITAGQRNEITQADDLTQGFQHSCLIADKAYDKDAFIKDLESHRNTVVIPPRKNRKIQRYYDPDVYKERHLIECFFGKLKQFRRIFSRFDKCADTFLSFIHFVSTLIWLR